MKQDKKSSLDKYIKRNRLFILGAGFSADANIPLTSNLLSLTMDKFSKECPNLFERVDMYAHESIERYDNKKIDYSKEIDFSNLCTFLEYIELREYGGGERWKNEGSREKLALRFYLAKTIAEYTPALQEVPQMYIDFANQLHEHDIVISFNWDCLLEVALMKIGKPYTYNWDNDSAIKLCKLHGSINWRLNRYTSLGKVINTLGWKSLHLTDGIMDVEIYHSSALLNYERWQNFLPLDEVEPFLVLPGYGKSFDVRSNAVLWYKPEFAFSFTHDVYIIGLSMSPDDFFIRSLFLSNLPHIKSQSCSNSRKVFIINKDNSSRQNYNFILSRSPAEFLNDEFKIEHINLMKQRLSNA